MAVVLLVVVPRRRRVGQGAGAVHGPHPVVGGHPVRRTVVLRRPLVPGGRCAGPSPTAVVVGRRLPPPLEVDVARPAPLAVPKEDRPGARPHVGRRVPLRVGGVHGVVLRVLERERPPHARPQAAVVAGEAAHERGLHPGADRAGPVAPGAGAREVPGGYGA